MRHMFGKKPKPKQESLSERPEAFQWADRINRTVPGGDEWWQVWKQAYRSGIVIDFDPNHEAPDFFYPEGAEADYTVLNPDE